LRTIFGLSSFSKEVKESFKSSTMKNNLRNSLSVLIPSAHELRNAFDPRYT